MPPNGEYGVDNRLFVQSGKRKKKSNQRKIVNSNYGKRKKIYFTTFGLWF